MTASTSTLDKSSQSGVREYQLSDDLARLCLPQEFKDNHRKLAWVNSICALFLAVGLVGLKQPKVILKEIKEPQEVVPVVFTPPEEPPQPQQLQPQEEQPTSQESVEDVPQVVVVAAADAPNIAFAVPTQGATAIAAAVHLAPPPPANPPKVTAAPPTPKQFNPTVASDGGVYPEPRYPQAALRNRWSGTVEVRIEVAPSGQITSVSVNKSSGHSMLDDAATDVVKTRWRFPAGPARIYIWPCIFKMN